MAPQPLKIEQTAEFTKDLKKLRKRFHSLDEDLKIFEKTQFSLLHQHQIDNHGIVRIPDLGFSHPYIFKVRKFACKALKGRGVHSGIRLTYAFFPENNLIQLIEIYFKADSEVEDRARIKALYSKK